MADTLRPASLRQGFSVAPQKAAAPLAMMTATALGAAMPAHAQDAASGSILLPTINIETSEPAAVAPRRARAAEPARPAVTAEAPPPAPVAETAPPPAGPVAGRDGVSPYVDPNAGYRAVSSANSLLGQPLLDTARTVTAITGEVLSDKDATSVRELARTTPGLTLGTGEGGNAFGDVLFIRGFKASNDTFIDGMRDAGVAVRETFMAEQVEVTKGPSGSIAGRGTTGGAVNLVTKKAQPGNFTRTETTLGTDGLLRQTVDWNREWNERLRTRVGAMAQNSDVAGRDGVFDNRRGLSFATEFQATERLRLSFDAYHLEMDQMPDWGVPWDSVNGVPMTEAADGRATVDRDTFYGVTDRDFLNGTQDIATFGATYEIAPGMELTNRLRMGRTENDYVLTAPERPNLALGTVVAAPKSRRQVNDVVTNQTELTFAPVIAGREHRMVVGLELSNEDVSQQGYTGLASEVGGGTATNVLTGCTVSIFDPDTSACWDADEASLVLGPATTTTVKTRSLYFGDTVELRDDLILNFGLRLDDYSIGKKGVTTNRLTGETTPFAYSRDDTMVNWNAGLTWKPQPNGAVYLAFATSSNPMGQELDAGGGDYGGLDAAAELLAPEKNRSIELGTKWELGGLLVSGAIFETEKSNARETVASGVYDDTGEYRVRGLELGVAGNLTEKLSLFGGATLLDSEITESYLDSGPTSIIGNDFANIAHKQFNLLAKYEVNDRWTLGGQATWRGEIKGGTFAADQTNASGVTNENRLPGYWRFDLMADYEVADNAVLSMRVNNVTDELYYDAFYRSASPYVYVAPGRSASVSLQMKF